MSTPAASTTPKTASPAGEIPLREIITDSAALLEKTAALAETAAKVPELESKVAALEGTITEREQKIASDSQKIAAYDQMVVKMTGRIEKFAEGLVTHGSLTKEKLASFVARVSADPSQIVDVMEKLAQNMQVSQLGGGEGEDNSKTAGDKGDPISKFALS